MLNHYLPENKKKHLNPAGKKFIYFIRIFMNKDGAMQIKKKKK